MDATELLRRAAKKTLLYDKVLSEEERAEVERASEKVRELLKLADSGRLGELCGATPAELVKSILSALHEKPCMCPTCQARGILE